MKITRPNTNKRNLILYIVITAVLVILAALLGYHLTKRYKETITDTYNMTVSNISERIDRIQDNVANEISKLEESVAIDESN